MKPVAHKTRMECNEEGTFRNTNEAPEYEKKKAK